MASTLHGGDARRGTVQVKELRGLTEWSEGHVWVSPEMHGTITGVFKNQIDWLPLNTGTFTRCLFWLSLSLFGLRTSQ